MLGGSNLSTTTSSRPSVTTAMLSLLLCSMAPARAFVLWPSRFVGQRMTSRNDFSKNDDACSGHSRRRRPVVSLRESASAGNEWGVPWSSDLPPLAVARRRGLPPKQLPNGGKVTLLGSGPGDPDLLTVAAYKLLTSKDENTLVVVDRLVSKEILDLIQTPNVKIARKLPGCADLAQEEIYWWCYQGLNQGKHVIRLKIGDPFVFGRGGEEVLTFRRFGVDPTVVPGVSAAFSAPLLGNIPVTHRGVSNQVVMCTGYGREGTSPDLIQYHKQQTVVFLMAVGRLAELTERLQTMAGYPADTPVAIVERAGCPNQRTVVGDMTTIADLAVKFNVKPPSTIVVGEVVRVLLEDGNYADGTKIGSRIAGLVQNFTMASM